MTADLPRTALVVALTVLCIVYFFIATPLQIWFGLRFWRINQKQIPFFSKRHPTLVLSHVALLNSYPLIWRPITDFLSVTNQSDNGTIDAISTFCANIFQFYVILIAIRLWLLYYDFQHQTYALSLKWKSKVTPSNTSKPSLEIINGPKWCGDPLILSIIGTVFGVVLITMITATSIELLALIPLMMVLILLILTRKSNDHLSIQWELQINGVLLFFFTICYIVVSFALTQDDRPNLRRLLLHFLTTVTVYSIAFMSTWWVLKQYGIQTVLRRKQKQQISTASLQPTRSNSSSTISGISNVSTSTVRINRGSSGRSVTVDDGLNMEEILVSENGFDRFSNHLVTEFCAENLFFIVELVQIKKESIRNKLGYTPYTVFCT